MNHGLGWNLRIAAREASHPHFLFRVVQARQLTSFVERCVQSFVDYRNRSFA
jgi:hypothetical protein